MRTLSLFMAIFFAIAANSPAAAVSTEMLTIKPAKVTVYYFHYERRCATCVAVEEGTQKALNELYATQMKKGEIVFKSINLEDKEGEALADKLKVAGQTLLITNGDKKVDITEKGFLYAKSNPEKFKAEIEKAISQQLKK